MIERQMTGGCESVPQRNLRYHLEIGIASPLNPTPKAWERSAFRGAFLCCRVGRRVACLNLFFCYTLVLGSASRLASAVSSA